MFGNVAHTRYPCIRVETVSSSMSDVILIGNKRVGTVNNCGCFGGEMVKVPPSPPPHHMMGLQ